MKVKSVKVSEEHHRLLKISAAERGVSLQLYLAYVLELCLSNDPALVQEREKYLKAVEPLQAELLERAKRHTDLSE